MEERQEGFDDETQGDGEAELDPWNEEGWYFDLPAGAWERQEAKNRALREHIRANVKRDAIARMEERKKDPFAGGSGDGLSGWIEGDQGEAAPSGASPWGDDDPWPGMTAEEDTEETEWEPVPAGRAPRDQATANWGKVEESPVADDEWEDWGEAAALRPQAVGVAIETAAQPEPEAGAEAPKKSRWEEMFGAPPEGSIVDAMKEWSATKAEERARERDISQLSADMLAPFDWETEDGGAPPLPPARGAREPQPETLVADDSLAATSWNEFATTHASATEEKPAKNKPGFLARVLGGKKEADEEGPEWARGDNDGWQARPQRQGWVEAREKNAAAGEWAPDDQPADAPVAFKAEDMPAARTPAVEPRPTQAPEHTSLPGREAGASGDGEELGGPRSRSWGAPATDADGSLRYELPRRFIGRNVWDDGWLEDTAAGSGDEGPEAAGQPPIAQLHVVESAEEEQEQPAESARAELVAMVESIAAPPEPAPEIVAVTGEEAGAPGQASPDAPEEAPPAAEQVPGPDAAVERVPAADLPETSPSLDLTETEGGEEADQPAKQEESAAPETADGMPQHLHPEAWLLDGAGAEMAAGGSRPAPAALTVVPSATEVAGTSNEEEDPWAAFLASREDGSASPFRFSSDRESRRAG
jgi:hypothetical protein